MKDTKKGLLIVISGPAGSGKGTVNSILLKDPSFVFSVSATTRAPRPGEQDGVNYYYISHEDFESRIAKGEMLEYTSYCGNYYGTPKKEAEKVLDSGKNLILEIEVEGAMNVKKAYPEAILIMLLPPSFKKQEERLRGRATETEESIAKRLRQTKNEIELLDKYDYVVYNHDNETERAANDIRTIVLAESMRSSRQPDAKKNYFCE